MFNAMVKMRNNKKKGFTLIELIVVIAILAIIAMLAIPAYNGLRSSSADKIANANARTVYTAGKAYIALNPTATTVTEENLKSILGADFNGTPSYDATTSAATWKGKIDGAERTGTYPTPAA